MCLNCWQPPQLSRRQFITQSLAVASSAALALTLSGCQNQPNFPLGQLRGTMVNQRAYPALAGRLGEITDQTLTIETPAAQLEFFWTTATRWEGHQGLSSKRALWPTATSALVWVAADDPQTVTAVQALPPIGTVDDIPVGRPAPEPTLEKTPVGPLDMITRAGWGAAATEWVSNGESGLYDRLTNPSGWLEYDQPLADVLNAIVVHHSALEFHDGPREVQALHQRAAGFADVGYHFLIDGAGQLYEGRPLPVRGAHTGGFNTGYVGICLLGNYEFAPILTRPWETLRALCSHLRDAYTIQEIGGHRDYQPGITACPGRNLHPDLPDLSRELNLRFYRG